MADYRAPAGSIIPKLFIGMGGTGSRVVDRIAARAVKLPNWDAQLKNLVNFVTLDTNDLDQDNLSDRIPPRNRINIAAFDKRKAVDGFRRSQNHQAEHWIPGDYQPREGVRPGAGQIRIESRLGFFFASPKIKEQLKEIIQDTMSPRWANDRKQGKYSVYIICSLAGGTGSGSFLSMAYLVQEVCRELDQEPRIIGNMMLSTLLTGVVENQLHANIHANTYAAIKELEHLTKLDYEQTQAEGRTEEEFYYYRDVNNPKKKLTVSGRPFFMSLLYDEPAAHALPDYEAAVADTCFLQLFTPLQGNIEGELDNYEQWMTKLTTFPGRTIGRGYTQMFGAVGAAVLTLPGQELLDYCALRFAAQGIRQQITFGLDKGTVDDDQRVRRLQQYAVDYTNKKFLNMAEAQRFQVINTAFVKSVREMAKMDEEDDQPTSYWATLVDRAENGAKRTGADGQVMTDEEGLPMRERSILALMKDAIERDRERLMSKIIIKAPGFTFSHETLSQYDTLVDRLQTSARKANAYLQENLPPLLSTAREGNYVSEHQLDPIAERYLVLRLLVVLGSEWLPAAEADLEKAKKGRVDSASSQNKLHDEIKIQLSEAANTKRFFSVDIEGFNAVRDQCQQDFKKIAKATMRYYDRLAALDQLRALEEYLLKKAQQYAKLSERMEGLVKILEADAEKVRRGDTWERPPFAMQVEVFQSLEGGAATGQRDRMWGAVYNKLFIEQGKFLTTFNRDDLSTTIKEQLKPFVRADGRTQEKTPREIEDDIRKHMIALGQRTLRPTIFGSDESRGLDLMDGLRIEAEIVANRDLTPPRKQAEHPEVIAYAKTKIRALGQLTGVIGRVDTDGQQAAEDGVKANRSRRILFGERPDSTGPSNQLFNDLVTTELSTGARQAKPMVAENAHHDPHIVVVHDVELGVPVYYFRPVIEEIGPKYTFLQNHPREFRLHTAYQWEKGLPNLDPSKGELAIDWTLRTITQGLITGLVNFSDGWQLEVAGLTEDLGENLTSALYFLESKFSKKTLGKKLEEDVTRRHKEMGPDGIEDRRLKLIKMFQDHLTKLELAEDRRGIDPDELRKLLLDRPAMECLVQLLQDAAPQPEGVLGGMDFGMNTKGL